MYFNRFQNRIPQSEKLQLLAQCFTDHIIENLPNDPESHSLKCCCVTKVKPLAVRFMSCHVSFHIPLLGEFPVTVWTLERFDPVVAERVPLETVQGKETFGALRAQVWTISRVRACVDDEVTLAGEALPTVDAGVRHLTRVRPIVQPQLPGREERLSAGGAQEVPFPLVHLHVSNEAVFAEVSFTDVAKVGRTFMQALVLLERITTQEPLVALLTGELSPSFVKSLMVIVPRLACKSFLAINAAVAEGMELHVCLKLVRMFKSLLARWAFEFFFCEAFLHRSRTQEPFIFSCGLFPFSPTFVFRSVLLLVMFPLFVDTVFLFGSLLIL